MSNIRTFKVHNIDIIRNFKYKMCGLLNTIKPGHMKMLSRWRSLGGQRSMCLSPGAR